MALFAIIMGFTVAGVDFSRRQAMAEAAGEAFSVSDYAALMRDQATSRWQAAGAGLQELRAKSEAADVADAAAPAPAAAAEVEKTSFFSRFGKGAESEAAVPAPTVFACSSERGFKSCKADSN
ncbi:hypothetical protein [Pseudoruegeria sp. SHC-113]|uniref:hypothetical protein n=1 Tax=Pseudoruegeria sp. SHC-113 TaxID=2855439 RepID=UPI0021BA6195|nr:hypothetical protein [Pseudoruegeria sp. SHC-113]MCT8161203.1 hypothetical protein [Pseudoruegeria sp. SHC-113]